MAQGLSRLLRPGVAGAFQALNHLGHRVFGEHRIQLRTGRKGGNFQAAKLTAHPMLNGLTGLKRRRNQGLPNIGQATRLNESVGQMRSKRLCCAHHVSGQAQILADSAWATAEKVTATHIREQPNIRLRHGHLGALGHHAQTGPLADAHATAHDNPVHEGDVRFAVGMNQMIQRIFFGEKISQGRVARQSRLVKETNVSTCTKGTKRPFFALPSHHHGQNFGVCLPLL